jgi:homoprotocatechuate degradation regulator HpaR
VQDPQDLELNDSAGLRRFSRSLPMALLRAREAVMERFRPNLRRNSLTDQQWRVLRVLFEYGKKDLGELSNMCCLLKPSITRIIRSMEKRSLLEKRVDSQDHRRTIVSITAIGRDLIYKIGPNSELIYQDIALALGSNELDDLYRNLDTLIAKLDKNCN